MRLLLHLCLATMGVVAVAAPPLATMPGSAASPGFAYAIYNGDDKLINDPLADFDLQARAGAAAQRPITDVYVLVHGWNYTVPEAISNYQQYLDGMRAAGMPGGRERNPFLLLVSWSSISRPVQESVKSLFMYDIDRILLGPAKVIDEVVFHLPSAWNQALHAFELAAGRQASSAYFGRAYADMPYAGWSERQRGRDVPLAFLLFELTRWRGAGVPPFRVHVIGHSYGAKAACIATIEAVRRQYEEHAASGLRSGMPGYAQGVALYGAEVMSRLAPPIELDQLRAARTTPGNRIESLVLFNPAFHPRELWYLGAARAPWRGGSAVDHLSAALSVSGEADDDYRTLALRQVPRKLLVFSNSDAATGDGFNLSQITCSNAHAQMTQGLANTWVTIEPTGAFSYYAGGLLYAPVGVLQFGWNSVAGVCSWTGRKAANLPFDFVYHVGHNDSFAWFGDSTGARVAQGTLNTVHFFAPLDKLASGRAPADRLGLFRPATGACGRTGFAGLAAGRPARLNLGRFAPLYDAAECELRTDEFERLTLPPGMAPLPRRLRADRFYSADASSVYTTRWGVTNPLAFEGAHNDLHRGPDMVRKTLNVIANFTTAPIPPAP